MVNFVLKHIIFYKKFNKLDERDAPIYNELKSKEDEQKKKEKNN